ncbi:MAG: phosphonopyruvate decarboxylase, partial [Epulopiscium sp.]|nr:phosphonopyruvate decarboxylase [Candidatus Epulonipiscium sp.]
YDIPALFVVGWRGEPGIADEPQHKFQGIITEDLFKLLGIKHEIIDADTNPKELESIFIKAKNELNNNKQFTIIVKKNTFEKGESRNITNDYKLIREDAIKEILKQVEPDDMIVSTTGKISREVYEQSDLILGSHQQNFLTVGAMGHASSIALALSKECKDKRVYCIDGDGAVLMHMGTLAFIAKQNPENLIHIVLNNDAHESVGGMPTGAVGLKIADLALASGYPKVYSAANIEELSAALKEAKASNRLSLIEVKVGLYSREDLIRPKESAQENKKAFMKYHGLEAN